jgi:hypothetical protein
MKSGVCMSAELTDDNSACLMGDSISEDVWFASGVA